MLWIVIVGIIIVVGGFVVFFGAPYVPSQRRFVERAFEKLYRVSSKDLLVDVGSGDGIVLRIAAEKGARAIGYEIHPLLVFVSRLISRDKKISIRLANFWQVALPPETTIVYAFAVSRDGKRLVKKVQSEADRLQKELVLMCHASPLPEMKPEKTFEAYHLYRFHPLQAEKAQV